MNTTLPAGQTSESIRSSNGPWVTEGHIDAFLKINRLVNELMSELKASEVAEDASPPASLPTGQVSSGQYRPAPTAGS